MYLILEIVELFFFSSRRRHTRSLCDWSSDVCSSDLSRFVNGLRVTTPEIIDAVLKVFAGSVNHELVSSFVAAGANAVGLSGIDAALVEARSEERRVGKEGG